jgi:predicted Zn finger-like uncharacterized protein
MVVECSNCHAKYNIDENKIPPAGVKVRCQKCQHIIFIKREEPVPQPIEPEKEPVQRVPEPVSQAPPSQPEVPSEPAPVSEAPVEPPGPPAQAPPQEPEPSVETIPEPEPGPAPEMSEDDKKWNERARRLAKALASDLVLYNQDKVEEGLIKGTIAQLLGAEIRRSWEYYIQQIPKHIVENTDYFKEQLNKIVGKGKEIFK